MKIQYYAFKNLSRSAAAISLSAILLSSCLKESTSNYYSGPVALVTAIQGSPDEPQVDFYLGNEKVNWAALNYGDGIDYFKAYAGKTPVAFYKTGTMTKVAADTVQLNANTAYSLFLTNTPAKPQVLLVIDSLSKPASGSASIRFINLSPGSGPVSLSAQNSQLLISNEPFRNSSSFIQLPGNVAYTFSVNQGNAVLATLPNTTLQAGSVYTIWYHGLANPTGTTDGLKADIITNAVY